MTDALSAIEAAIAEVTKARATIRKQKSIQVSSAEEIDQLKSVSFAWFETHRPIVAAHGSHPDLSDVDSCYRVIMDSTGRRAARATYSDALLNARRFLVELRSFVATNLHALHIGPSAHTADTVPNFAPLAV